MKHMILVSLASAVFSSCLTVALMTSTWVIGTRNQIQALREDVAVLRRDICSRRIPVGFREVDGALLSQEPKTAEPAIWPSSPSATTTFQGSAYDGLML